MPRFAWMVLLLALASISAGAQMLPDTSPRAGVDYEVLAASASPHELFAAVRTMIPTGGGAWTRSVTKSMRCG